MRAEDFMRGLVIISAYDGHVGSLVIDGREIRRRTRVYNKIQKCYDKSCYDFRFSKDYFDETVRETFPDKNIIICEDGEFRTFGKDKEFINGNM